MKKQPWENATVACESASKPHHLGKQLKSAFKIKGERSNQNKI
jgi:hypothetical protein